jgi:organic radical activating enzyme
MDNIVKYKCIDSLKKEGDPIIVVAAVNEAEAIIKSAEINGIKVSGVCDSEKRKSLEKFSDLEVYHTPILPQKFSKARFIIASQHIQECAEQLIGLGYNEFYSGLELLKDFKVENYDYKVSKTYMSSKISVWKKTHEHYFNDDQIYMRSLDIMLTTKCSLKCRNCSNLMQYYKDPTNTDYEKIISALNILDQNVDTISEFRIIGGEPLMNKDWANIVNKLSDYNNKAPIFIYTNATIAPKVEQLKSFQGKDINFIITDYGKLSKNIDNMIQNLEKFNISYKREPANDWVDCSRIKHHKRPIPQLEEVFKQCCVKYLYTLLHGKLYRCPFIANAANLNAIPDNPGNYVNLFSDQGNIKNQIQRLVKVAKFFPGCDFCDGRPYDPTSKLGYDGTGMIAAGEQVTNPISYKSYK